METMETGETRETRSETVESTETVDIYSGDHARLYAELEFRERG